MSDAKGDLGFCTTDCKYINDIEGWDCEDPQCYKKNLIRVKFRDSDRIVGIPLKDGVTIDNDKDPLMFTGAGITTDDLNNVAISGGLLPTAYKITVTKDNHRLDVFLDGETDSILEVIKKLKADIAAAKAAAAVPGAPAPVPPPGGAPAPGARDPAAAMRAAAADAARIAKLNAEIARITAELAAANTARDANKKLFDDLTAAKIVSNATKDAALTAKQAELAAKEVELAAKIAADDMIIDSMQIELARRQANLDAEKEKVRLSNIDKDAALAARDAANAAVSAKQIQINELEAKATVSSDRLRDLTAEKVAIADQLREANLSVTRKAVLEAQLADIQTREVAQRAELAALKGEKDGLVKERNELTKLSESLRGKLEGSENQIGRHLETIQQKSRDEQLAQNRLNEAQDNIRRLLSDIEALSKRPSSSENSGTIKDLRDRLTAAETNKLKAEQDLSKLREDTRGEINALRNEANEASAEATEATAEMNIAAAERDAARERAQKAETTLEVRKGEEARLSAELAAAKANSTGKSGQIDLIRQQLESNNKQLADAKDQLRLANEQLSAKSARVEALAQEAGMARGASNEQTKHIATLTAELEKAHAAAAEARSKQEAANNRSNDIQKEMIALQEQIRSKQAEVAKATAEAQERAAGKAAEERNSIRTAAALAAAGQSAEIAALNTQLTALGKEKEAIDKRLSESEADVANKEGILEEKTAAITQLSNEKTALQGQNTALQEQLTAAKVAEATSKAQKDAAEKAQADLAGRLKKAEEELNIARIELKGAGSESALKAAAEARVAELNKMIALLQGELEKARTQVTEASEKNTRDLAKITTLESQLGFAQGLVTGKDGQLTTLSTELDEARRQAREFIDDTRTLTQIIIDLIGKYEGAGDADEIARLKREIDRLNEKLDDDAAKLDAALDTVNAFDAKVTEAAAALKDCEEQRAKDDAAIRKKDGELNKLRADLEALQATCAEKDAAFATLKAECAKKDAELATLRDECAKKDAELAALRDECAKKDTALATLKAKCAETDAELATLKVDLAALKAKCANLDSLFKELEELKANREFLTAELAKAKETKPISLSSSKQIADLTSALDTLKNDIIAQFTNIPGVPIQTTNMTSHQILVSTRAWIDAHKPKTSGGNIQSIHKIKLKTLKHRSKSTRYTVRKQR